MSRLFGVFLLSACATLLQAQPADTMLADVEVLAYFDEARTLAIDAAGMLFVVDAGKNVVLQLDPDGQLISSLGGPGAEEGQFDAPSDFDPTNGLVWVVADAGNSRLQRFSHTFLHMETLPVARVERFTPGIAARLDPVDDRLPGAADGRPIAVATSSSNELFAIEETQGVVLKWDASRRLERAIGGFEAGAGALVDPVALAVDATQLYVADRGQASVEVYDMFGGYVRSLAHGRAVGVSALTLTGDDLWIVLPSGILVYTRGGRLVHAVGVQLEEALVDAAPHDDQVYLLTAERLLRAASLR